MFKKSLVTLLFCGLLTLAAIVAYAVIGWRGPEDTIREAQAKIAAAQYAEVISLLDQAELGHSIQNNRALKVQLWQLRMEAHAKLGNARGALQDVSKILDNGHANDINLRLDQIRLLATDNQGERALLAAKRFLADNPDHSRGLELAGEASQTAYQPILSGVLDSIERTLGASKQAAARAILLTYLFRPSGDAMVKRSGDRLAEMFKAETRLALVWPDFWTRVKHLRTRIQEGLGYFQASLDLGGEPVAAFRAIAIALEQSGRIDDLLFLCEIQRRMFQHAYVGESGVLASWVRIQSNLPSAAIATCERWMPTDQIETRWLNNELTETVEQLALARALAAWNLRSKKEMTAASRAITTLRQTDYRANLALHLSMATRRIIKGDGDALKIEESLSIVVRAALSAAAPLNRPDFAAEFAPLWIDSLVGRSAGEAETLAALALWRDGRPNAIEPHLRTAGYLLALGRTTAAMAAIKGAAAIDSEHPKLFPLHLNIARKHNENSPQSGINLYKQCWNARRRLPDTRNSINYALCAEEALTHDNTRSGRIALACARSSINAFPRANIPRQQELQALLQLKQYEEAARTATLTIDAIEPQPRTLSLAIQAKQMAGEPTRDLLRMALPRIRRNPQMQIELLRLALKDAPSTSDRFIGAEILDADAPFEARVLAIRSYCACELIADATKQIKACNPPANADEKLVLGTAFADWVTLLAKTTSDTDLLAALKTQRKRLRLTTGPQQAMLDAAEALSVTHPTTAFEVLNTALPAALPEERNGRLYILAGELALANQDVFRAASSWTAALGFTDGQPVAERLARIHLLLNDEERALQVYAMVKSPVDGALAVRLGQPQIGGALLAQNLQQSPAALLIHATLSTLGQPTLVDWTAATSIDQQEARLELIAGLHDPLLGFLCAPRAQAILAEDNESTTSSLLLARAESNAGRAAQAGSIHGKLEESGYTGSVLWREVALAGQCDDYATSDKLLLAVMSATSSGRAAASPITVSFGAQQIVKSLIDAGLTEEADNTRLIQWKAAPQLLPCTPDDLELIARGHTQLDVCLIIEEILTGNQPCDRRALLEQFYRSAEQLLNESKKHRAMLVSKAKSHLATEGALGNVVHFILTHGTAVKRLAKRDMLFALLENIATGKASSTYMDRTIKALTDCIGIVNANRELDRLIDRYPTALPLWATRVSLRQSLNNDPGALDELRTVLTHALDPDAELAFLAMAAEHRKLTPADALRLTVLPPELLASPQGQYAQGLIASRQGRPDDAIERLLNAAPQQDGRHLYELAMAYTVSAADESRENAMLTLKKLIKSYPKSSLARHARSFARQLSPLQAIASDMVEKR